MDFELPHADSGDSILLLGPIGGEVDINACQACLGGGESNVGGILFVTFTERPNEKIQSFRERYGELPQRVTVVTSAGTESDSVVESDSMATTISTKNVADPGDLTKLGLTINRAYNDLTVGLDGAPYVCFNSITVLLQYTTTKRAFRFLQLLNKRLDANAHYHMDPSAHEQQTVITFEQLFDTVVEYDEDGNRVR